MSTARDLITASLRTCNAIGAIETPTSTEAAHALGELNTLIESWDLENLWPYTQEELTETLTSGKAVYTIGNAGGEDFSAPRPNEIMAIAILVEQDNFIPIEQISNHTWYRINRTIGVQSRPYSFRYISDFPAGKIEFYTVPDTSYQVKIQVRSLIKDYGLNDTIALPTGYYGALQYNLALILCVHYNIIANPRLEQMAVDYLTRVKRQNYEIDRLSQQEAPYTEYQRYNIYTDRNFI